MKLYVWFIFMYGILFFGDRIYYMFNFGELFFLSIGRIFICCNF